MLTPLFTPRGEHYCLEEWRGKQRISPPGGDFTPGRQIHPGGQLRTWGQSLPLGVKLRMGVCQLRIENMRACMTTGGWARHSRRTPQRCSGRPPAQIRAWDRAWSKLRGRFNKIFTSRKCPKMHSQASGTRMFMYVCYIPRRGSTALNRNVEPWNCGLCPGLWNL
jgi:hypothetical protein